jgi:hypothetical protein
MNARLVAFLSGVLFGSGLAWSGMTNPARVQGFLDVTGAWDPTLVLVMASALAVAAPGFALALRRPRPFLESTFRLPTRTRIDRPLLAGAVIFGIGWGLAGLCPGPAIAGLVTGSPAVVLFVLAMVVGQLLAGRLENRRGF